MVASLPFLVTPQLGGVVMGGVVTVGVVMGRGGGMEWFGGRLDVFPLRKQYKKQRE